MYLDYLSEANAEAICLKLVDVNICCYNCHIKPIDWCCNELYDM